MINKIKFKIVYKHRFSPLYLSGVLLSVAVFLKYALNADVGSWLGWTIFLNIVSFIYYRGVIETKNKRGIKIELEKRQPSTPSKEEIEKMRHKEMQDEKQQQIQNIIFRSFYLF